MNRKILFITAILFFSVLFCNADDNFYIQTLSAGDDTESNSSITYTNKELPDFNKKSDDNASTVQNTRTTESDWSYYPYYYYPYYSTYRIGPYYSRGISVGGYNYTGFAYNYRNGNKIITTPVQRITVPNIQQNVQSPYNPASSSSKPQQNKT